MNLSVRKETEVPEGVAVDLVREIHFVAIMLGASADGDEGKELIGHVVDNQVGIVGVEV